MKNPLNRLVTLLFLWVSSCNIAKTQSPDLILTHGNIFTADTTQLYVQAIAIKGNKILAVGSNGAIEKTVSSKTQKIDLQGKTVVPGFNDAHDHPGWYAPIGKSYNYTELNTAGLSKEAVLDSVARLVKIALPNEWICGRIGTTVLYDTSMREVLDSIAPNNPVALQIWWGHGLVVNHKALEASGLSDEDTDPTGGWYVRTPGTNKINSLQQNAQAPVWIAKTHSEPSNLIKGLQAFAEEQLRAGITSVQFMGTGFDGTKADAVFREASLPQRIRIIAWLRSTAEGRQLSDWETENMRPASLTYISGIKYVIDGTPLEENALRKTPYPDRPGWYGRLNYPIDTMKQILQEALSTDRQLMLHITADSSFAIVLSLMQQAGTSEQWKDKRVRIEHNCVGAISSSQRRTLKDLGIMMMHTSKYCQGSPLRSLLEDGVKVGMSPDGTTNPFIDIMIATSMQTDEKENLTREEAVIAYTKTNAYAEFEEKEKGSLMPGMLADLVVLSQDIFTIPTEQLPATRSVLTMVDGKIVYEQPPMKTTMK